MGVKHDVFVKEEDGIRDVVRWRGLGDVDRRQDPRDALATSQAAIGRPLGDYTLTAADGRLVRPGRHPRPTPGRAFTSPRRLPGRPAHTRPSAPPRQTRRPPRGPGCSGPAEGPRPASWSRRTVFAAGSTAPWRSMPTSRDGGSIFAPARSTCPRRWGSRPTRRSRGCGRSSTAVCPPENASRAGSGPLWSGFPQYNALQPPLIPRREGDP